MYTNISFSQAYIYMLGKNYIHFLNIKNNLSISRKIYGGKKNMTKCDTIRSLGFYWPHHVQTSVLYNHRN